MSSNLSDACGGSSRDDVSGSSGVNSGDWICGDVTCRHSNFARRQQCKKCKRDRSLERSSSVGSGGSNKKKLGTEIGKAAAEKSRGLFSAEDWQCNKCANVNWARRMTCNMCNAPKFCDVEERTGFGGGYNDRGVVEYKEREESDSEYDEFGRLKKRRKNSFNSEVGTTKTNSKLERTIDEDEEDDEEDGDDDDLAKYNLFSDDEEIVPTAKSKKETDISNDVKMEAIDTLKSTNRRSRSRNRSDFKRRQSNSSSRSSSSSSSTSSSSTSSTSTSSSEKLSERSKSGDLQSRNKKRSHSHSHSGSRSGSPSKRQISSPRYTKKRSHDKSKTANSERRSRYNSKSHSNSRSSDNCSRSPSVKRNRSRNSNSSRKDSRSPRAHRKRSTRSRSVTPKRRR